MNWISGRWHRSFGVAVVIEVVGGLIVAAILAAVSYLLGS